MPPKRPKKEIKSRILWGGAGEGAKWLSQDRRRRRKWVTGRDVKGSELTAALGCSAERERD